MSKKNLGSSTTWRGRLGLGPSEDKPFPDAKEGDILILVMGPTGVGKSTFIREYTHSQDVVVGHKLRSCTRDVSWYIANTPNSTEFNNPLVQRLVLVDTPGFDDTYEDDSQILKRVSIWLARSYNEHKTVAGIIYVNDISQKRMFGSTRTNFKMFQKLCGQESFQKVVLATSQWDTLADLTMGQRREEELKQTFWKEVLNKGAVLKSIKVKPRDQEEIVNHIIQNHIKFEEEETVLQIQREIVDWEKSLPATQAGQELKYTLQELLKMQESARKNGLDDNQKAELEQKKRLLREQIKGLKLSLGDRFKKFFGL